MNSVDSVALDGIHLLANGNAVLNIGTRSLHSALSTIYCQTHDERAELVMKYLRAKQLSFGGMKLPVDAPEMKSLATLIALQYDSVRKEYNRLRKNKKVQRATDLLCGAISVPYPAAFLIMPTAEETHIIEQVRAGFVLYDAKQIARREAAVAKREKEVELAEKNMEFLRRFYEKWKTLPDKPLHNFQVKRATSSTTQHRVAEKVCLNSICLIHCR